MTKLSFVNEFENLNFFKITLYLSGKSRENA